MVFTIRREKMAVYKAPRVVKKSKPKKLKVGKSLFDIKRLDKARKDYYARSGSV